MAARDVFAGELTTLVEPAAGEHFLNPLWGTVTSSCGVRISPITGKEELHNGLDIAADTGTEVCAVKSGVVTEVRTSPSYGKLVKIMAGEHTYMFAHLSEILVTTGQQVRRGEVVAKSGNTGWSTGPHLHYSLWKGETLLDPMDYVFLPFTEEVSAEYRARGAQLP